jgi:hypothetical protein
MAPLGGTAAMRVHDAYPATPSGARLLSRSMRSSKKPWSQ